MNQTLADFMRQSESDPFLLAGPPAPKAGWIYRDFKPMPRSFWGELMLLLGEGNVEIVATNRGQQPPAASCRAQIWISPEGQGAWRDYLAARSH